MQELRAGQRAGGSPLLHRPLLYLSYPAGAQGGPEGGRVPLRPKLRAGQGAGETPLQQNPLLYLSYPAGAQGGPEGGRAPAPATPARPSPRAGGARTSRSTRSTWRSTAPGLLTSTRTWSTPAALTSISARYKRVKAITNDQIFIFSIVKT